MTEVKSPGFQFSFLFPVASTKRCLTQYGFSWPNQPIGLERSCGKNPGWSYTAVRLVRRTCNTSSTSVRIIVSYVRPYRPVPTRAVLGTRYRIVGWDRTDRRIFDKPPYRYIKYQPTYRSPWYSTSSPFFTSTDRYSIQPCCQPSHHLCTRRAKPETSLLSSGSHNKTFLP